MKVAISSGHGLYVRGASGNPVPPQADEVDEARRIVNRVAQLLGSVGSLAGVFHDNTSHSQDENLDAIVDWHNQQTRSLDVSVHLNYYDGIAHGTEVLFVSDAGEGWAVDLSREISIAGSFTNRGPKFRDNLAFLNNTEEPAVLLEMYFCDNTSDCERGRANHEEICLSIAETIYGKTIGDLPEQPPEWPEDLPPKPEYLFYARGRCSTFGGPNDSGVSPSEGLAFIYEYDEAKHLFLPSQPPNTTGLARRLDPNVIYVACRWDYDVTPKDMLRNQSLKAGVRNVVNGRKLAAFPADWGPHEEQTGRACDCSPALLAALGAATDDELEVGYPLPMVT